MNPIERALAILLLLTRRRLLPATELARRFELSTVAHSAGVFDEDKLAWVNRHYLKAADPATLVRESLPFLRSAGIAFSEPTAPAIEWLHAIVPALASSIDRLSQLPDRLRTIFSFDAAETLADERIRRELIEPAARAVVVALADVFPHERLAPHDADPHHTGVRQLVDHPVPIRRAHLVAVHVRQVAIMAAEIALVGQRHRDHERKLPPCRAGERETGQLRRLASHGQGLAGE